MIKIHCLSCVFIGATAEDGMTCEYKDLEYLEDYLDVDLGFCNKYSYNYCIDCNELEYIPDFDCVYCNRR